jgi:phosphoribosylformylglycinamidine synthase
MLAPSALVLRAPGTNCDAETAYAFELAGAKTATRHINRWLESPRLAEEFQILCLPGGFSYGDDIGAGRIFAARLNQRLHDALQEFRRRGGLILGICNGFQVLVQTGLLDHPDGPDRQMTLTWNDGGRFLDRWVDLETVGDRSVFLRGIAAVELPIAHAEGRFVARDAETFERLDQAGQLALRYRGGSNPNGSQGDVAGACDATGRVLGLMPHPERCIDPTHHPQWTRRPPAAEGAGLQLFRNAVDYFR